MECLVKSVIEAEFQEEEFHIFTRSSLHLYMLVMPYQKKEMFSLKH